MQKITVFYLKSKAQKNITKNDFKNISTYIKLKQYKKKFKMINFSCLF